MAFESGHRGQLASQINVTPLVDVMLVLLIIFMVTAPIIQQGVQVSVPKVAAAALPGKEEQFIVSITRDQSIYLNDTRMSLGDLTGKLRAIAVERPDREVFVRADEVEASWRLYDPVLSDRPKVATYPAGSYGPVEADQLAEAAGCRWYEPRRSGGS